MTYIKHIFALVILFLSASYGSAEVPVSNSAEAATIKQRSCITLEDQALLRKLELPISNDLYSIRETTQAIVILADAEKNQLIELAKNGCIDAQLYIWLAYTKGLYGFPKNTVLANQLKTQYKSENVQKRTDRIAAKTANKTAEL